MPSEQDIIQRDYIDALDDRLLYLSQEQDATLSKVIANAEGAFPTLVVERLKILGIYNQLLSNNHFSEPINRTVMKPELHPLDFEWYFTDDCALLVAEYLNDFDGEILCLGAPTVAASIARSRRKVYLVDNNHLVDKRFPESKFLNFILWDLNEPLNLKKTFPIVFFDAPWYLDSITQWLWQSSKAVEANGLIAFSIFPPLLRPYAKRELSILSRRATNLGNLTVERGILEYQTPLFEQEALKYCGIKVKNNWRIGDLMLISDVKKNDETQPLVIELVKEKWDTFVIGNQVIKLRNPVRGHGENIIEPVEGCPDFIYPTVSFRDPRRNQIDIWTSRNRVARVSRRSLIYDVLRHLSAGMSIDNIYELPILSLISPDIKSNLVNCLRRLLKAPLE